MLLKSKGKIAENLYVIGNAALPTFLWAGKVPVLFDAGMTFMGPAYFRDLESHLGGAQRLRYLLLTHSHYDHCGSAPYLKRKIPALKIGASSKAAEVLKRPNAIRMIQDLSKEGEESFGPSIKGEDIFFDKLDIDLSLDDSSEIDIEEAEKVRVITTPGHTRDSISFYLPWSKTLICGETVGTINRDSSVRPQFLAGYDDSLGSLEKISKLNIEILIMAHLHILKGKEARDHISKSIEATRAFRERVQDALKEAHGNQEEAVKRIFHEDYEVRKIIWQERKPYLINLTAQVKTVAEKP
jgi:glyoxylase-like metal-dependent hydrolase (beta-lactamase superfamily II)